MKYILNRSAIALAGILFAAISCNNTSNNNTETESTDSIPVETPIAPTPVADTPVSTKRDTITIKTTAGNIKVVLYNETPLHRANFMKNVKEKYYDGLLFHRVISGFMIQGGDPNSRNAAPGAMLGNGGPNYLIPAEIKPGLLHKKGALAAARTGNPEKASSASQFYICHVATPMLDGEYTVFGETIEGFEVIDKIAAAPKDSNDRPLSDIKIITMVLQGDSMAKEDKPAKGKK